MAVHLTGVDVGQLATVGVAGVLAGAAVGLIPGCAAHVVLTGLFVAGGVPFPVLIANAVGQDGDALFPLLLVDRRSAAVATVLTTVPAVLVGLGALALA